MSIAIAPAGITSYAAAFRALFSHLPPEERVLRAERAVGLVAAGEIDPSGLLVATDAGKVVGAILIQFHPGAAAVVSPPGGEACDELADTALAKLCEAGVKQAQALLPPEEVGRARPLEQVGFRDVTQLAFYCRPVPGVPVQADTLAFTPIAVPNAAFAQVLLGTYEGTLDCPELNGVRSGEEVLASYATKGESTQWWLAQEGTAPIGVVILTNGAHPRVSELLYLGLVPSARGRRLSRSLLRFALEQAEQAGSQWLTLSVDVRNLPAIQLYRRHEFRQFDLQHVYLWTAS